MLSVPHCKLGYNCWVAGLRPRGKGPLMTEREAEERTVGEIEVCLEQLPVCQSRRGLDYSMSQYRLPYHTKASATGN